MQKNAEMPLTRRQLRAAVALCEHNSIADAATAAGCSERAIYEWMKRPTFREALSEAQAAATAEALRKLSALQAAAVDTLASLMDGTAESSTVPANVRRLAASDILTHRRTLSELIDIEMRLSRLEQLAAERRV